MNYRKYSIYNLTGALIWGAGVVLIGYFLGYIPPVADFVRTYIDVILLGAVVLTLIPTILHYVQSTVKAKRSKATISADAAAPVTGSSPSLDSPGADRHAR